MNVSYDRKTKCWYARWRERQADDSVRYPSVRLMRRSDQFHSKKDVRKSEEYQAVLAQHGDGADAKHAKLLLAVAEARGKGRPDATDLAVVRRLLSDDSANDMLLATFVESVYWPFADANLRGKTVREYKGMWTRYDLAEKVSGLRVRDFHTMHASAILEAIASAHDVSRATLQHVKFFLSAIFVLAKNKGLCDDNPMQGAMLPKVRGPKETAAYTLQEILTMLRLPFDAATKAVIGVAGFAGLRESEIAGLRWGDYDGEAIVVSRSIDRVTGEANPPKTLKSAAPVPVIPTLRRLLEAYKATVALGPDGRPMPDAPMFPGMRQETADLDKMALRIIRPAIEAAALTWRGWHAFRRGIASNLFALGVSDLVVQRILRHSKVTITRASYIKVRDEKVEVAMGQLEHAIAAASENRYPVQ